VARRSDWAAARDQNFRHEIAAGPGQAVTTGTAAAAVTPAPEPSAAAPEPSIAAREPGVQSTVATGPPQPALATTGGISALGGTSAPERGIGTRVRQPAPADPPEGPTAEEIEPAGIGTPVARTVTGVITAAPVLLLALAASQVWDRQLHWRDIAIFLIMYVPIGLGITVGFHRLFTHRSFKTSPWLRGLFGVLGTMAIEGPVVAWVADHRKHHAYSDRQGDPHSPHVDHGGGWRGALRGLLHAHVGWLFDHSERGARERFAPDLLADPVIMFVDRTFVVWSLLGLAIPFGLGALIGGTVAAGLEGMLWGGAVRVFVLHHVTYSINSLCHFFGRRPYATSDHSRNLLWLTPFSFGEAWHNNHHAFPTSAFHGLGRWEIDLSGGLIRALERAGLVWDVQRVSPGRRAEKALAG
jgi:stearoyl-CoA desaturase (Delta-9 desaturase)